MILVSVLCLTGLQVSTTPAHRNGESWWSERHSACVERTKAADFDVAFIGDSITQGWEGAGESAWDASFGPMRPANFGFSGDQTQHVLWRLANGEILAAKPKVIVIMIGTNNIGSGQTPADAATGVRAIVSTLRKETPNSLILLLDILPREIDATSSARLRVAETSAAYRDLASDPHVLCFDSGAAFLRPGGTLKTSLMPDLLHLSADGYEVWARRLAPKIATMLKGANANGFASREWEPTT